MRSLLSVYGHLTFDPARFIVETSSNWSGGSNNSASELVLYYREIHMVPMPFSSLAAVPMAAASADSGTSQVSREGSMTGPAYSMGGEAAERDLVRENRALNAQVRKLETQIGAVTRRLTEESVLLQLRKDIDAVRSTKIGKDSRPSP